MVTYIKTKDGKYWVLFSDNIEEETMDLVPITDCDSNGSYDVETIVCENYSYSNIEKQDTNIQVVLN